MIRIQRSASSLRSRRSSSSNMGKLADFEPKTIFQIFCSIIIGTLKLERPRVSSMSSGSHKPGFLVVFFDSHPRGCERT